MPFEGNWQTFERGMKKGEWYTGNDCKHSKNQATYAFKRRVFVYFVASL
jgi:hypothetical protein